MDAINLCPFEQDILLFGIGGVVACDGNFSFEPQALFEAKTMPDIRPLHEVSFG